MAGSRPLCLFLVVLMITGTVKARWLEISDGVHDTNSNNHQNVPFLSMGVSASGSAMLYAEGKRCESIYGFLPCADTIVEAIFLIVMYAYALMLGEDWLRKGSAALLVHFKNKKIAGSVFRVLRALPRVVIVIVSGVLCTQADAQNQVAFGVAMYAGSTVISLTGIWGVNVILKKEKLHRPGGSKPSENSSSTRFQLKDELSFLTETGISVKEETKKMALIMLLSLIPFVVVILGQVFSGPMMILFALIVSALTLVSYIVYQIRKPRIQDMSVAYVEQEHFQVMFLKILQKLTNKSLYDKGEPNKEAIEGIFNSADRDNDGHLSRDELKELISTDLNNEEHEASKEYAVDELLRHFDADDSGKISMEEFKVGCNRWLKKLNAGKDGLSGSQNILNELEVVKGIEELNKIKRVMPVILVHLFRVNQKIVNANGEIQQNQMKELFDSIDIDGDGQISCDDLEKAIASIYLGEPNPRAIAIHIIDTLDSNHSGTIDETEFTKGLKDWIAKAKEPAIRDFAIDTWDTKDEPKINILYALIGIAAIYLFVGPFIQSVIQFSNALHVPFIFTSFVVAPFFMNARSMVIFAFSSARRNNSKKDANLTFFELYSGLVMNNLMGLTTLLTIVYVRGLTWNYTAEVVTIIMIGVIQGVFASFSSTYPLWTSFLSFLLYGMTICLFCVYTWDRV